MGVCVRVCVRARVRVGEVGDCKGQDSSGEGVCVLSCFSRVCMYVSVGVCVCVKLLQSCLWGVCVCVCVCVRARV